MGKLDLIDFHKTVIFTETSDVFQNICLKLQMLYTSYLSQQYTLSFARSVDIRVKNEIVEVFQCVRFSSDTIWPDFMTLRLWKLAQNLENIEVNNVKRAVGSGEGEDGHPHCV